MEDIVAMLTRDPDFARYGDSMRVLAQHVFTALPAPPVATAAPLAPTDLAAWGSDGVDRISFLPVAILRNVVSRLPAKDAARTTVLSKRWRRVWHSVPLVLLDAHLLPAVRVSRRPSRALAASVSRALAAHPGPFRCVYLTGVPMDAYRAEVARWLQLLATNDIKELVFVNRPSRIEAYLELPASFFTCATLTRLYIGFSKFPDTAALPPAAAWFPYLLELGLCSVAMDDHVLAVLLHKCPSLQKLIVIGSPSPMCIDVTSSSLRCVELCTSFVPEITVRDAPRLQRLLMWEAWGVGLSHMCSRVRICNAPNLRCLGFLVPGMHQLEIGNTIIKVGTEPGPDTTVPSVGILAIKFNAGSAEQARMLLSFLKCFPNVVILYIQFLSDEDRQPLGPHSTTSNTEELASNFWEGTGPVECVQWHIRKVVLRDFRGSKSEILFFKFLAKRARTLQLMVVMATHGCSDQALGQFRTAVQGVTWAHQGCVLAALRSPFQDEGTPWCYVRASDLTILDPFDSLNCLAGKCRCP